MTIGVTNSSLNLRQILELVNCERDMGLVSFIKDILMRYIMISSKIVRLRKISRLNLSWFVRKVLLVHIIVSQYQHCYWHSAVYDEARFLTSYINYLDTVQKQRFAHLYKWYFFLLFVIWLKRQVLIGNHNTREG